MRTRISVYRCLLLCALVVLSASWSASQTAQTPQPAASTQLGQADFGAVYFNMPKPGQQQEYVAGRKKHVAWHASQNDRWTWQTFEILNGENGGGFITTTLDHKWADFDGRDQFDTADQADANTNIQPFVSRSDGPEYWRVRRDLARSGTPPLVFSQASTPMLTVTHFILQPGTAPDFEEAIKRINAGLDKANYTGPKGTWYQSVNGGETPHFVLVTPRKNFADMDQPPVRDALLKAYGVQGGTLQQSIGKMSRRMFTEMLRYRPDLSYTPAQR